MHCRCSLFLPLCPPRITVFHPKVSARHYLKYLNCCLCFAFAQRLLHCHPGMRGLTSPTEMDMMDPVQVMTALIGDIQREIDRVQPVESQVTKEQADLAARIFLPSRPSPMDLSM